MGLPKNIQLLDLDSLADEDLQPAIVSAVCGAPVGLPVYDEDGKLLGSFCIVLRKPKKGKD